MPQPAPAPMITPSETIKINNQTPDQTSVTISVGQAVEIHNEDNVPYELPISYLDGNNTDNYPLSLYIPAGGKVLFIGTAVATCQYNIDTAPSVPSRAKRGLGSGPYTIGIDSGEPGGNR